MSRRKRVFVLPTLKKTTGRNGEIWHIEFSYRCAKSDQMIRKRISKPLVNIITYNERHVVASKIIAEISEKLLAGWTPEDDDKTNYVDVVEYHQTALVYGRKKKSNRTVRFMVSKFMAAKNDCKKSTIQNYTVKLRKFTLWCEKNGFNDVDISTINNSVIQDYFLYMRNSLKRDPATIKHYRTMLWSFFNWSNKQNGIEKNPVFDIEIARKDTDFSAQPFLQHDANRILNLIEKGDKQLYLACLFQYYTAIRPGTELRLLKIKDLDFQNNCVMVISENAKNRKKQGIDIAKELTELCVNEYQLQTYNRDLYVFSNIGMPGTKPLGKNNMRERFNRFRDALNLPHYYKYYSFKHTGAGKLLNSGASIEELRNHLRHTSIETTHKYAKEHFGERNKRVINSFPPPRS